MRKIIVIAIISIGLLSNCSSDDDNNVVDEIEITQLTQEEIDDLSFLREEEKLARDVYIFSFNKYQIDVFNSISNSEQMHMDKVLNLMNIYEIPDSASTEIGVFNNQDLQDLYFALTTQSDISSIEALTVGAIIEDLDINDIDHFINNTSKDDLLTVYDKLTCGSKNHIRSYTSQLESNGVTYIPQFISIDYYATILNEPSGGCGGN